MKKKKSEDVYRIITPQAAREELFIRKNIDNPLVNRVKEYIENNYSEEISLNKISKAVHVSHCHIAHLFREYVGATVGEYINIYRLVYAAELLEKTDYPIKDIRIMSGFRNDSYFCVCFLKYFGMSAREYRRAHPGSIENC
ncbi:MAG: helix-turn-helix domain-containing protein [Lachnospiraceae bacterium]|jgi:YesN/AraC family two-component response regulator